MKTGHTPSRSNPEYWLDCAIPWFTLADVWQLRDGKRMYIESTENQISQLGLENSAAELLPARTVVLSRTASVGFSGIMKQPMATSQDFWNWICGPRLVPEFLVYVFRAMRGEFQALMIGSTHKTIYQPVAAAIRIPVPPIEEQRLLAEFLDRETAQIDALIEEQRRLIELLHERRRVQRASMALHGVDLGGKTVLTDLFWAQEIPRGWTVVPLTSVAMLESGHTPSRERIELWKDCYIPWVSLNDVGTLTTNEYISTTTHQISDAGIAASSARVLPEGTVVLSRDATIGRTSIMAVPMATSQHFADWVCGPRLDPRYLWLLFTSAMQPYFDSLTNGSTLRTIGMGALKSFKIPLPPIDEQHRIVAVAEEQAASIDTLSAETERFIELSKERRAALIAAAVTGQIDLGGEVAAVG
jgi:type I restriction enzyme, S subunit